MHNTYLFPDELGLYDNLAWRMAHDWLGGPEFDFSEYSQQEAGAYYYFVSAIYFLFGHKIVIAKLFNVFFSLAAGVLLFLTAKDIFNERVASFSFIGFLFLPSINLYSLPLLRESFMIFLLTALFFSLTKLVRSFNFWCLLFFIASFLLMNLVRPHVLLIFAAAGLLAFIFNMLFFGNRQTIFLLFIIIMLVFVAFPGLQQQFSNYVPSEKTPKVGNQPDGLKIDDTPAPIQQDSPHTPQKKISMQEVLVILHNQRRASEQGSFVLQGNVTYGSWRKFAEYLPYGLTHFIFSPVFSISTKETLLLLLIESLYLLMLPFAVYGLVLALKNKASLTLHLLLFVVFVSILYATIEANVGTLLRHRIQIVPFIILFAANGLSNILGSNRKLGLFLGKIKKTSATPHPKGGGLRRALVFGMRENSIWNFLHRKCIANALHFLVLRNENIKRCYYILKDVVFISDIKSKIPSLKKTFIALVLIYSIAHFAYSGVYVPLFQTYWALGSIEEEVGPLKRNLFESREFVSINARQYGPTFLLIMYTILSITSDNNYISFILLLMEYLSIAGIIYLSYKILFSKIKYGSVLLAVILLNFSPLYYTLSTKNVEIWEVFLLLLSLYCFINKKRLLAGVFIALAAHVKILPVIFILYFLFRDRKVFISSFVFSLLLLLLSTFVIGINAGLLYWPKIVTQAVKPESFAAGFYENNSLKGFLFKVFSGFKAQGYEFVVTSAQMTIIQIIIFLLIIVSLFFIVKNIKSNKTKDKIVTDYGLITAFIVLFSPLTAMEHTTLSVLAYLLGGYLLLSTGLIRSKKLFVTFCISYVLVGIFLPFRSAVKLLPLKYLDTIFNNTQFTLQESYKAYWFITIGLLLLYVFFIILFKKVYTNQIKFKHTKIVKSMY